MPVEREFKDAVELLDFLAVRTWDMLTDGHDLQISISEETITDINLLEIRRSNLRNVAVVKFPKLVEAKSGADWDLWIGNDSDGWLRYLIQAKKLHLRTSKYVHLRHYHLDERGNKILQIDQLYKFALQTGAIPAYCFYNGGNDLLDRGSVLAGEHAKDISTIYGCTISSYYAVRAQHDSRNHGSKTFASLHPRNHSFPWSALVQRHYEWIQKFVSHGFHPLAEKQSRFQNAAPKIFSTLPKAIRQFVDFPENTDTSEDTEMSPSWHLHKDETTNTRLRHLLDDYEGYLSQDYGAAKTKYPESVKSIKNSDYQILMPKRIGVIEVEDKSQGTRVPPRR